MKPFVNFTVGYRNDIHVGHLFIYLRGWNVL